MTLRKLFEYLNKIPAEALDYEFRVSQFEDIDEEYEVEFCYDILSIDIDDEHKEVVLEIEAIDDEFDLDLD